MKKVIVVGGGGHAKVVIDILEVVGEYKIVGIIDKKLKAGDILFGYPVLGNDDVLPGLLRDGITCVAMGIGGFVDNKLRKQIYIKIKSWGFTFVNAIHPSCIIMPGGSVGEGVVMFPGVVVNSSVIIGNNVILATGSTTDHETVIEDHVLVSAGVSVGAYTRIQEQALIAIGATIVSGVNIGKSSLVAAGAVVLKDVPDSTRVVGIPARVVKQILHNG